MPWLAYEIWAISIVFGGPDASCFYKVCAVEVGGACGQALEVVGSIKVRPISVHFGSTQ